ncbi:MAG: WecB/TagA/CpsF family glycosyltransferase [Candidatus Moranbacteria bacterium]|nr:WecB/TagA/CpsF family glycosyltransferase [Candidatus Moranbacteria bacterium]
MNILNVRIDNLEKKEIIEKIENFLGAEKFHQIATINPEFILAAQKNREFRDILNNCDLNLADGAGIKFAFWRLGGKLKVRISGVDLMWEILRTANDKKLSVYLVANNRGLSNWEKTRDAIRKIYPDLKIEGLNMNCHSERSDSEAEESNFKISSRSLGHARNDIFNSDIVFCNFGHPNQEKFLNTLKNGKIKLAVGVGGSFDFVTGKLRRAPRFMRDLGLEWLFRLIQQPKRFRRIFNAIIIFPIKVFFK